MKTQRSNTYVDAVELHRRARAARAWMIGELFVRAAKGLLAAARGLRRPPSRRLVRSDVI